MSEKITIDLDPEDLQFLVDCLRGIYYDESFGDWFNSERISNLIHSLDQAHFLYLLEQVDLGGKGVRK